MTSNLAMPDDLRGLVDHCIQVARAHLARDGRLVMVAILGGGPVPPAVIPLLMGPNTDKDLVARVIQRVAAKLEARFIVSIGESWYLGPDHAADYHKILKQYGSLADAPMAKEGVHFVIESHAAGCWAGVAEIIREPGKPPTFGDVQLESDWNMVGRFVGLLPKPTGPEARQ